MTIQHINGKYIDNQTEYTNAQIKKAVEKLGDYAENSRTGELLHSRIARLIEFMKENKNVTIEINNNWSVCPRPTSAKASCKLGGTTYQYQVWAVSR